MADADPAVILDNGSGLCKIGYSGEQEPRCVFPAVVGKRFGGGPPKIGDPFGEACLLLEYPVQRGFIYNWDDMIALWEHAFSNELDAEPGEQPLMFIDRVANQDYRGKVMEIMFEKFCVPSLCIPDPHMLGLYSACRTTGVILDCGDGVTEISCFVDKPIIETRSSVDFAGCDITAILHRSLSERGYTIGTASERETVRDIKEKLGYVALDFDEEMKKAKRGTCDAKYALPSGEVMTLGNERFRCSEILFNPSLCGRGCDGIHEALFKSIMKCSPEHRKVLFESIVVCGGTTMLPGFVERLEKELKRLAPVNMKVTIHAEPERKVGAWVGGSIFGQLATFPKMLISRKEYQEAGPILVARVPE